MNDGHMLDVKGLRVYIFTPGGVARAVDDVTFHIDRGEVLGLVGESGCGKTMTALSLLRLVPEPGRIVGGEINFEGEDLLALPEKRLRQLRGSRIGMVFQEPAAALNPVFTIGYQVGEALMIHKGLTRRQAREEAVRMLAEVAIPDPHRRALEYPHQLSGGMLQRVMIASALVCGPSLLVADEPTSALDMTIQAQIVELLLGLRERHDLTVLLITHDLGVVAEMADRVAVMYAGRIVEEASTRDLFRAPLHPYTQGLLRSIPGTAAGPTSGTGRARLQAIEGVVPGLLSLPAGCAFAPRCPQAMPACSPRPPALLHPARRGTGDVPHGARRVACFLHEPEPERTPPVEGRGWDAASGR
ncbi:MAG: ABC transporter ATP-binding protein [Candidatus Polarisedimenticolia bacterium]